MGVLAAVIHLFSVFEKEGLVPTQDDARLTSFSDNVVVSIRYDPAHLNGVLMGLARVQAGLSMMGFFLRGAVTIGDLSHTAEHVFGPALNRAYFLESKCAVQPRIILDPDVAELQKIEGAILSRDANFSFIDPFDPAFIGELIANQRDVGVPLAAYSASLGTTLPDLSSVQLSGKQALAGVFSILAREMATPLRDHDWAKLAWLFDRLAARLGLTARSSDVPRIVAPE